MKRKRFIVNGRVQGVGFRPFVFRLATELSLKGWVSNSEQGVVVEVQGSADNLEAFGHRLMNSKPPLARILNIQVTDLENLDHPGEFNIVSSSSGDEHQVLISPDAAVCPDCQREILDPVDRRYLYPFTNCTNCGPRLTITSSIPYDRPMTSMACFEMCPDCRKEYHNPLDRRFHAQPNACPVCGPGYWLADREGRELARGRESISKAAELLILGKILAVKGLGGFHLVCDAGSSPSVAELRQRKNRPGKSLAVMVQDIETAKKVTRIDPVQESLLSGQERPIVILPVKNPFPLSPLLSPDTGTLGIMLPYTPFHVVLFQLLREKLPSKTLPALVMTSGNFSSEPICLGNREAMNRLKNVADFFLFHDRDILIRCDDSVVFSVDRGPVFMRRARGFTPSPIFLSRPGPCVLGAGPELKNTICLTKNDQAYVSQHVGDLKNLETYDFFLETVLHFQDILRIRPAAVVRDLHPDYLSSKFANHESGLPVIKLQHHYAHIFAVMAENRYQGPCLGVALDGTGLGEDNTLWGGELLLVDNAKLTTRRLGSFTPVPLPGGEQAIIQPWRIAFSFLHQAGIDIHDHFPWPDELRRNCSIVRQMLDNKINSPLSSGCGRLFDAVAALLGLVQTIEYEGQGAIRLEAIQDASETKYYEPEFLNRDQMTVFNTVALFESIFSDLASGTAPEKISRRFHLSLAHAICKWIHLASRNTGLKTVGLSGGVMQNMTLFQILTQMLTQKGYKLLVHTQLPPNDACVSLGQAVYGQLLLNRGNLKSN